MTLAEMSLKRPVTAIMLFVSMTVIGLIAAFRLPLESDPDVQFPFMAVNIPYPGSTPGEIERTITRPVEEALSTLTGVQHMQSMTSADAVNIFLQFKWGQDVAIKAVDARAKIDAIRSDLPSDLQRYSVQKFSSSDQPVLGIRISSTRDMSNSYELLDRKVKRPLEHLPGVARVDIQGVSPNEVQIEISSDRLTAAGVGLNDLYQRLSSANFSAAGGLIRDDATRYRVQPVGEWHSIEEVRDLAINDKGLKLSDIADVTLKPKRLDYARHLDHRPAIAIDIYKERSANLVEVGRAVTQEMDRISADPEMSGIRLYFLQNQADGVTQSLKQLTRAGIEGTLLSIIVLFFFLRDWPSTLMVSLAIPICFIITLGCMQMLGMTLNILSMMGLLLAVGMLVDNAVVVVESIYQYREKYPDQPWYCAVQGTQVVGIAIAAGTLSSIIVFLPMVLGEKSGVSIYLTQVAVSMAIAHLASWLVAVSLVPMLSAKLPPPKFIGKTGLIHSMQAVYARVIAATLRHRRWTILGLLALLLLSFIPAARTKVDMFPANEGRQMHLQYQLNALYTLPELKRSIESVENWLEQHRKEFKIKSIYSFYSEGTGDNSGAMTNILFDENEEHDPNLTEIIRKGLPKVPIGEISIGFNNGGSGSDNSIQLSLNGDSSAVLRDLSKTAIPVLQSVPALRDVRSTEDSGNHELAIRVDREKAKTYGFSASDIAQFVQIALRGMQLKDFHGGETPIPVWLRFQGGDAKSLDSLSDFKLHRPDGTQIPLMSMIEVQTRNAASVIERDNRQTSFGIKANLAPGATLDEARKGIEAVMKNFQMPPGYKWSYGQNFDQDNEAGSTMLTNTLVALVLVYVVMCAMFESLIYPAAILTTFVFSVFGVFWTFWITGTTFTIMASIGVLILMGVIVNNGIVMIVHINQLRHEGMDRRDALIEGARDRLRPILMTMGTAILGMVPLCIGNTSIGGDGPAYYPMARAIAGGLFFSTAVSLIVLPTIYSLLDDASLWAKHVLRDARARGRPRLREA
jgi:HAE1 family hydrophobic/amphiphilic exporter-1